MLLEGTTQVNNPNHYVVVDSHDKNKFVLRFLTKKREVREYNTLLSLEKKEHGLLTLTVLHREFSCEASGWMADEKIFLKLCICMGILVGGRRFPRSEHLHLLFDKRSCRIMNQNVKLRSQSLVSKSSLHL